MKGRKYFVIIVLVLLSLLLVSCNKSEYVITFDTRGGNQITESVTISTWTKKVEFPTPEREGYTFEGWYTDIYCTMPATLDNIRQNALQELVLYAKWKGKDSTLKFDSGGGIGNMASLTVASGDAVVIPANTFTKEGHAFAGWASIPGGEVEYASGTSYIMGIDEEYTLYAIWAFDYNYYSIAYFQDRVAQLADIYGIQTLVMSDHVIEDNTAINEFLENNFAFENLSISYIDFIVYFEPFSVIFSMANDIFTDSFIEMLSQHFDAIFEHVEEEDKINLHFQAMGNLVMLTVGGGLNSLWDTIANEGEIYYLVAEEEAALLRYNSNNTSFTIPTSFRDKQVFAIESGAFAENANLTSIVIPTSVTYIGYGAFEDCPNLTIKCVISNQPEGWHAKWKKEETPVIWNYSA